MGYYRYHISCRYCKWIYGLFQDKERSFYLQQTADAIETEWEAVEVGVGRYRKIEDENERLAEFVEEVHRLKFEQKKRQQNLEQPESPGLSGPIEIFSGAKLYDNTRKVFIRKSVQLLGTFHYAERAATI